MAIPFSILDFAPIVEGGTAVGARQNSLDFARHAERFGTIDTGWRNITTWVLSQLPLCSPQYGADYWNKLAESVQTKLASQGYYHG
jgi:hypothetical protein